MVWERRIHYPLSIKHTDYTNGNPIGCVSHFRLPSIYTCRTRTTRIYLRNHTIYTHPFYMFYFCCQQERCIWTISKYMSVTITTALRLNFFTRRCWIKGGMMLVRLISKPIYIEVVLIKLNARWWSIWPLCTTMRKFCTSH